MNNRPQFTVRDLLIWTTVLAIGIVLLKLFDGLEASNPISPAAETVMFFPAWTIFPLGLMGILVVPAGMMVMLAAMADKNNRTFFNGLFLLVTTICWGAFIADGDPHANNCLLMLLVMAACSACCFIKAHTRRRTDNPNDTLIQNRSLLPPIASAFIVVATNLSWGTGIILTQI